MDNPTWWVNNGVGVTMLVAIGVGCFYAAKWLGRNFLTPIKDRILRFFDTLETALQRMGEHDARTAAMLDWLKEHILGISETCRQTEEYLELLGARRRRRRPKPPSDPMRPRQPPPPP